MAQNSLFGVVVFQIFRGARLDDNGQVGYDSDGFSNHRTRVLGGLVMNPWHEDTCRWHQDLETISDSGIFDPLCVERSAPVDDEEAAALEALCKSATPGPLVIDDEAPADGAVIVTLPDGRTIISLSAPVEQTQDSAVTNANAALICKARYLLLRLLRDRTQWKREREALLEQIRRLQDACAEAAGIRKRWRFSPRPR